MITYADAGVDIEQGSNAVDRIKDLVSSTFTPSVVTQIGGFGAGFSLKELTQNYHEPVLMQSMDGIGTKTIVARMANQFDGLGHDLLSACANDILVLGAKPLTILDYLASEDLSPTIIEQIISGMVDACCEHSVALIGGEMAQMPQTYLPGEWDIVGIVTGVVERAKIINGERCQAGDVVVAFAANGLHTNGYSLARHLLFTAAGHAVSDYIPQLETTLDKALLAPHLNYAKPVLDLLQHEIEIHGMAHITGGGIWDNIPRVLPNNLDVEIKLGSWQIPPIFDYLISLGGLDQQTAYHTFNMGLGLVMIMPEFAWEQAQVLLQSHPDSQVTKVGQVVAGSKQVRLVT